MKATICGYWLINRDAFYYGQWGSDGSSDLIPCKNSINDFCKVSQPFLVWCFLWCSVKTEQSPLLEIDTYTKHRHRCRLLQQTEDRRHKEKNMDNSNLELFVLNQLQGKVLLFLSLTWHPCITGDSGLITTTYNLHNKVFKVEILFLLPKVIHFMENNLKKNLSPKGCLAQKKKN